MPNVALLGPTYLTSRQARVWSWIVGCVLGILFLVVATPKLMGLQFERELFQNWGYPLWFMYAVGLAEAVFGIMLFFPQTRFWAACLICIEMVGAAFTHIQAGEFTMLPMPIITFALAYWLAWLDRPILQRFRGPLLRPARA